MKVFLLGVAIQVFCLESHNNLNSHNSANMFSLDRLFLSLCDLMSVNLNCVAKKFLILLFVVLFFLFLAYCFY